MHSKIRGAWSNYRMLEGDLEGSARQNQYTNIFTP